MSTGNSFETLDLLRTPAGEYRIHRLGRLQGLADVGRLPFSVKVLL